MLLSPWIFALSLYSLHYLFFIITPALLYPLCEDTPFWAPMVCSMSLLSGACLIGGSIQLSDAIYIKFHYRDNLEIQKIGFLTIALLSTLWMVVPTISFFGSQWIFFAVPSLIVYWLAFTTMFSAPE